MNIDVYLSNKEEFYNKFNEFELNTELGNYMFDKAFIYRLNKKQGLKINIKTEFEVDDQEKNDMIDMIRSYYGNMIKVEYIYLKTSYIKSMILFVVGIILLMCSQLIQNITNFVLPEIFVIIGWLAIGEMTYDVVFYDSKHRLKIQLLKKLTKCYVEIN